jgi:hypothetical protein
MVESGIANRFVRRNTKGNCPKLNREMGRVSI